MELVRAAALAGVNCHRAIAGCNGVLPRRNRLGGSLLDQPADVHRRLAAAAMESHVLPARTTGAVEELTGVSGGACDESWQVVAEPPALYRYSERLRSLRRALNMNAKYAGEAGHCAERDSARCRAHICSALCSMPAFKPP